MLRNGLARQIIGNIPAYMGGLDILPCKGDHKVIVELIPVKGQLVDYHSDVWDFSAGFRYQRRSVLAIRFNKANPEFKNYIKDYAAQMIDSYKCKVSTVNGIVSMLIRVLNYALETSSYGLFILLSTEDIIRGVEATQMHQDSRRQAYSHIMALTEFMQETHGYTLPIDLEDIGRKMISIGDRIACNSNGNHHRNIPEDFYNAIINTANRVMRDESQPFNMRMTGGIILLDSQLGLRMLEILALEQNCIYDRQCSDGQIRHFSIYNSIKAAKADVEVIKIKSICTPVLYETWKYMRELRQRCQYKDDTNFMYILNYSPQARGCSGNFPISPGTFSYNYKVFFGRYLMDYISKDWKGIARVKVPNLNNEQKYSIPTIHNFRVHFATSLYRQGFPLDFIESIMSHTPQSNVYDSYYDLDDLEYRKMMQERYRDKHGKYTNPDEEFEAFLEEIED